METIKINELREDVIIQTNIDTKTLLDQSRANSVFTQKDGQHETIALRDNDGEYFTVKRIRD